MHIFLWKMHPLRDKSKIFGIYYFFKNVGDGYGPNIFWKMANLYNFKRLIYPWPQKYRTSGWRRDSGGSYLSLVPSQTL